MTTPNSRDSNIIRVALKRADVTELIEASSLLSGAPLIKHLGGPGSQLVRGGTMRRIQDKAVLFQQGDAGSTLLFILAGDVRLLARKGTESAELGTARPGEILGEQETLSGSGKRAYSAIAASQVDVLELERESLLLSGRVTVPLQKLLEAAHAQRSKALDEMNDFLNRW